MDRAVKAARRAFNDGAWSRAAPEHRKAVLLKLADLVRQHADELATLECLDSGKTISDCLNEIGHEVPTFFQWYAELIDKSFGKVAPTAETALALIVKEPIGVAGVVLPWNFPLLMAAWKAAPALASGCSVVLKPAEQTPLTALRLAELATEAGVPPGVFNVVPGFGETAGQAIGRHPDIDVVSFTGSTEVGAYFLRYSSESNLKPVGLEMGGKSPMIMLEDAVINDDLVSNAVSAACWNGGQNCSANMRQLVHAKVKDEFLDRVLEKVRALKVGDPLDAATQMGSMITKEHRERVLGYVESRQGGRRAARRGRRGASGLCRLFRPADGVRQREAGDADRARGDFRAGARRAELFRSGRGAEDRDRHGIRPARHRLHQGHRPGDPLRAAAPLRHRLDQQVLRRRREDAVRRLSALRARSRATTAPRRWTNISRPRRSGSATTA